MKTLLDSAEPLSRKEIVDAHLDDLKQQKERLRAETVAEMKTDEDFRRDIHRESEALGEGRRGSWTSPAEQAAIRSVVVNMTKKRGAPETASVLSALVANVIAGDAEKPETKKREIIEALEKTFGLGKRQATRHYNKVLADIEFSNFHGVKPGHQ